MNDLRSLYHGKCQSLSFQAVGIFICAIPALIRILQSSSSLVLVCESPVVNLKGSIAHTTLLSAKLVPCALDAAHHEFINVILSQSFCTLGREDFCRALDAHPHFEDVTDGIGADHTLARNDTIPFLICGCHICGVHRCCEQFADRSVT